MKFEIKKKLDGRLARAGVITTPHGNIETPAFVVVGTKATVKALTPEQAKDLGAEAVLANTYHLYLEPGSELVKKSGGLGKFMNWQGPTFTDSGGFQVFSLGAALGKSVGKIATGKDIANYKDGEEVDDETKKPKLVKIDENGVTFRSFRDGSEHRFTPERSMEIQNDLGADIIFAFDECTSPLVPLKYQREAMERTHRWAIRSLDHHNKLQAEISNKSGDEHNSQALFGIIQGGRFEDLRKESAKFIGAMDFDGFGIGGSFTKEDMGTAVRWVNEILPENKPRHLLGIGEPIDLFLGIENGCDIFDCVAPTRLGRGGTLYTKNGKMIVLNSQYRNDTLPIGEDCECYTCKNFSRAYLGHLFRANEMLAGTLASIHNLYFMVNLVKKIRQSILDGDFYEFKEKFLFRYYSK
ncbi:MAG: tRNA guanosine(34) transglycosylase Tgt [Patescibacteria group bacterium]